MQFFKKIYILYILYYIYVYVWNMSKNYMNMGSHMTLKLKKKLKFKILKNISRRNITVCPAYIGLSTVAADSISLIYTTCHSGQTRAAP